MTHFALSLLLQAILMFTDEFFFHRRREMPRWERWGHPLDSLMLLCPLSLLLITSQPSWIYIALAALSCITVTKDEWAHSKHCEPTEHWLHAMLFIIHPLVLITAPRAAQENPFLYLSFLLSILAFGLYQLIYWNFYEPRRVRFDSKNS